MVNIKGEVKNGKNCLKWPRSMNAYILKMKYVINFFYIYNYIYLVLFYQ